MKTQRSFTDIAEDLHRSWTESGEETDGAILLLFSFSAQDVETAAYSLIYVCFMQQAMAYVISISLKSEEVKCGRQLSPCICTVPKSMNHTCSGDVSPSWWFFSVITLFCFGLLVVG